MTGAALTDLGTQLHGDNAGRHRGKHVISSEIIGARALRSVRVERHHGTARREDRAVKVAVFAVLDAIEATDGDHHRRDVVSECGAVGCFIDPRRSPGTNRESGATEDVDESLGPRERGGARLSRAHDGDDGLLRERAAQVEDRENGPPRAPRQAAVA